MSAYANGLQIHMNEVVMLTFMENTQMSNGPVASISVTYEVLKQMHEAIGQCLEQYNKRLHEVQRTKENMN